MLLSAQNVFKVSQLTLLWLRSSSFIAKFIDFSDPRQTAEGRKGKHEFLVSCKLAEQRENDDFFFVQENNEPVGIFHVSFSFHSVQQTQDKIKRAGSLESLANVELTVIIQT